MAMNSNEDPMFELPDPSRSRLPKWVKIAAPITVVVVAGAISLIVTRPWSRCGDGVTRMNGECIGVTDGSYSFNAEYDQVTAEIKAENDVAAASRHAVTIALLEPFTVTDTTALNVDQVRNELEGAYTAQWRANHSRSVGDPRPMIRLVLANEGSAEGQWRLVTRQLEAMVKDSAPLVAVAGLGVSFPQTVSAAHELGSKGVPSVGAVVTADGIDYSHVHGFVRVEPDDEQFVASLRRYLSRHTELNSSLVVYDNNSDNGTDLYTRSLRNDMESMIVRTMRHFDSLSFTGSSVPSQANPDMFSNIVTSICSVGPKLVLYSGREVDLIQFLTALESRECRGTPITVMSGGTDLGALYDPAIIRRLHAGNLSFVYSSATDAIGWSANVPGTPPHFADFRAAFTGLGFDSKHLDDGDAIATHDAVLTAAKAVRLAYASESGPDPALPKPQDVLGQLLNLNNKSEVVPAAAGDLSFSYRGADTGNPECKPIPVLRVPPEAPPAAVFTTPC